MLAVAVSHARCHLWMALARFLKPQPRDHLERAISRVWRERFGDWGGCWFGSGGPRRTCRASMYVALNPGLRVGPMHPLNTGTNMELAGIMKWSKLM